MQSFRPLWSGSVRWLRVVACICISNSALAQPPTTHDISIEKARSLYLEGTDINYLHNKDHIPCAQSAQNSGMKVLPTSHIPTLHHKGFRIIGSPYYPVWTQTDQNSNAAYFARLIRALDLIEAEAPQTFEKMQSLMRDHKGYMTIHNFCPSNGQLLLGGFATTQERNFFIAMISSTALLMTDLFNEYDVASILVHEIYGHGSAFFTNASLAEVPAFEAQAQFSEIVGDDKFLDANNRSENIRVRMRLRLSVTGGYVSRPSEYK